VRAFACPVCSSLVVFENSRCLTCSTPLGFSWAERRLVDARPPRHACANAGLARCNWTVDEPRFDGLAGDDASALAVPIRDAIAEWLPLSVALNALNRSLGHDDLYPYVLTGAVIEKLTSIDELVRGWGP
jgi:hypothetical protein